MSLKGLEVYLLALALLFPISSSGDGLYKWVDDNGATHYGDKPPENAELKKIISHVTSIQSVEVDPSEFDTSRFTAGSKSRGKPVVMYSTSWCGYCKKARQHFERNNIAYKELDIEKSRRGAREYKQLKGRGVPVILIGKRKMNGFNATKFDDIYYDKS